MIDKVKLAAEAGGMPPNWKKGAPEYVARLDYAMMKVLGIEPSIRDAATRWGVTFPVARRLINESKQIRIFLTTEV